VTNKYLLLVSSPDRTDHHRASGLLFAMVDSMLILFTNRPEGGVEFGMLDARSVECMGIYQRSYHRKPVMQIALGRANA
jgi:hypothetical protein